MMTLSTTTSFAHIALLICGFSKKNIQAAAKSLKRGLYPLLFFAGQKNYSVIVQAALSGD